MIDETSKKVVNLTAKTAYGKSEENHISYEIAEITKKRIEYLSNNTMAQVPEEIMSAWNKILG
ncbi:MAG: hypothetical protein ACFWTJ_07570 [Lachnoclostridium sp.]